MAWGVIFNAFASLLMLPKSSVAWVLVSVGSLCIRKTVHLSWGLIMLCKHTYERESSKLPAFSGKFTSMSSLGARIRQTRLDKGLTQNELARLVHVSREAVSQWESGDSKGLKPENLVRVAKVLGVDVEYLVTGKPSVRPRSSSDLTSEEVELLTAYREGADKAKQLIRRLVADVVRELGPGREAEFEPMHAEHRE